MEDDAPPNPKQVNVVLIYLSGRLQVAKVRAIRESGPWTLLRDGASGSKGECMINFVASSPQRIIHLATLDAQWAAKCASRAAAWLEQELQAYGLNNFAAVVMDGAAVMRAAWALPRVDPDLQERRLVFMVRGAHGQLARGGRRRALPLGSQGALNMFPLGSSGFVCCFPWVRLLFPLGSSGALRRGPGRHLPSQAEDAARVLEGFLL